MTSPARRRLLRTSTMLFASALGLPAKADPQAVTLIVGEALDENGKLKPLRAWQQKLFEYLEQELEVKFEVRMYPWARAERNARGGAGLIFGLPKSAERLRDLRYSDPAMRNTLWLVTRSDATFPFESLADLKGKTIGAVRGYGYGDEFEQARNKLFRVEDDIPSRATRLQRLLLKRVDAVLLYQPSWQNAAEVEADLRSFAAPLARELSLPYGITLSVLPHPVQVENQQFFAVAKGKDDGLIDRINAALAKQQKPASLPKTRRAT
ncbi:substrate-binding periplasmic protein [Pseudoduganella sp. OTU4001]|uniref:substrate-binding periplasmic protein n=1 Tax=Pseudoduganella sp. OTU4001 TaxID=3043854 RepID=UPI00313AF010